MSQRNVEVPDGNFCTECQFIHIFDSFDVGRVVESATCEVSGEVLEREEGGQYEKPADCPK